MRRSQLFASIFTMIGVLGLSVIAEGPVYGATLIWAPPALEQIIKEGLEQNGEIQSLSAMVEGLKEEIPFAGSLDDPRLGIGMLNLPTDTFSFNQEPMTQKQVFIAQKIPWFGKLSLREQKQALSASRQQAILEAKRFELARKIATAYYQLGFLSASLEINGRLMDIVGQVLKVAETRYGAGKGLQQDVFQAQVESSKLLDEKITLERKRRIAEDRINELLNRENFQRVSQPKDLSSPEIEFALSTLQEQALRGSPWLKAKRTEIEMAEIDIQLARKDYRPDMDFIVGYAQREEDLTGRDLPDFFSASMVINIPLWQKNRQDKNLAAKQKSLQAVKKSYEQLIHTLPHRVDALATDIHETRENYKLFSGALIVQARQWAKSSLDAYVVGQIEFNSMISAQIRLLNFDLMAKKYLFDLYQKRAELEEVIGGPIESHGIKMD
jgi:cobalt-zinc-cadmium efflux system outer membrane protein